MRFKIGDGVTRLAALPYTGVGPPPTYVSGNLVTYNSTTDALVDTGVSIADLTTYA